LTVALEDELLTSPQIPMRSAIVPLPLPFPPPVPLPFLFPAPLMMLLVLVLPEPWNGAFAFVVTLLVDRPVVLDGKAA
jgi:hypothetical protein